MASASAPHGRIVGAFNELTFVFSNDRWPLARSARPLFPAIVNASPARGLTPPVGMKVTNGLSEISAC